MAAGDTVQLIRPSDLLILNAAGNLVGIKNPRANGADLYFDPTAQGRSLAASTTLTAADAGTMLTTTPYAALTVTVPSDTSANIAIGSEIYLTQLGQGQITIAGETGVTLNTVETLTSKGWRAIIGVRKVAANQWNVFGQLTPGYSIGAELLSNGNFASGATGWTAPLGWTISGGFAKQTGSPGNQLQPTANPFTTGNRYRFTFTISNCTAGHLNIYMGAAIVLVLPDLTNGVQTFDAVAPSDVSYYGFVGFSGFNGWITDVSVRQLT